MIPAVLSGIESPTTSTIFSLVALTLVLIIIPTLSKDLILGLSRVVHKSHVSRPKKKVTETTEVVSLMIYPIKSCRGIRLTESILRSQGLDLDRRWMLVDAETNEFITIRQISEMTLINTRLSEDGEWLQLSISGHDDEFVQVPSRPSEEWLKEHTRLEQVKVWAVLTDGYVYGEEVNGMLSRFLQRNVCLVYKGPTPRVMTGNGDPRLLGRTQTVNFPDGQPVLIGSEASLRELNSRLPEAITVERFRPNIILKGNVPWSEDSWALVRVRDEALPDEPALELDILSRCMRCQVPNVDPDTAQKSDHQPWDTLMSYRRIDKGMKFKPAFGMNAAPRSEGEIRVGMTFEVLEETNQHRYLKAFGD